jgi:hypothetical protein
VSKSGRSHGEGVCDDWLRLTIDWIDDCKILEQEEVRIFIKQGVEALMAYQTD